LFVAHVYMLRHVVVEVMFVVGIGTREHTKHNLESVRVETELRRTRSESSVSSGGTRRLVRPVKQMENLGCLKIPMRNLVLGETVELVGFLDNDVDKELLEDPIGLWTASNRNMCVDDKLSFDSGRWKVTNVIACSSVK
jgi:hypothetical protein